MNIKIRQPQIVVQNEVAECGLACVSMLLDALGIHVSLEQLRERHRAPLGGMSLDCIQQVLCAYGVEAAAVQFTPQQPAELPLPAIVHFGGNHFVLVVRRGGSQFQVLDPACGARIMHADALTRHLSGFGIVVQAVDRSFPAQFPQQPASGPQANFLWPETGASQWRLPLFLQLLGVMGAFLTPLYIAMTLDKGGYSDGILVLAALFLAGTMAAAYVEYRCSTLLMRLSAAFAKRRVASAFMALLSNHIGYFERRPLGDIYNRFSAFAEASLARTALGHEALAAIVAGTIAMALMLMVSPALAMVGLLSITAHGVASTLYAAHRDRLAVEQERVSSEFADDLYENIRGAATVKISATQGRRGLRMASSYGNFTDAWQANERVELSQRLVYGVIGSAEILIVVTLAVKMIGSGTFGFATFYTCIFLRHLAMENATKAFLGYMKHRRLRVAEKRGADFIEYAKDALSPMASRNVDLARIELRDVSFTYDAQDMTLKNVQFTVAADEKVVLEGESGSGKTTLMKLLCGLYSADSGRVLINGAAPHDPAAALRNLCYFQRHDDVLFRGSVLENITLFEDAPDTVRCKNILEVLGLLEIVLALPAGLNTQLSESNPLLSAGQKQRLLLSRALYSQRPVLVFDEPTANLDTISAEGVIGAITAYSGAVIVISHDFTHRPYFDRTVTMNGASALPQATSPDLWNQAQS